MRRVVVNIILLCFMITSLVSCSIRKHIPEGEMILKNNVVEIHSKDVDFTKSDISSCITQASNPKFLGLMPLTWVYYKTDKKKDKKFVGWINKTIGKKPVYFNDDMKENSVIQIGKYLNDVGYFNSGISTEVKNKRGISKVYYNIYPAKPYFIDSISYKIADSTIYHYVKDIEEELPAKKGEIYNAFVLDDERDMITEHLKNNGYFYFTKDYIFMEVDTNFNARKANINIRIDNVLDPYTQKNTNHKQYKINNIYIYPKGNLLSNIKADTIQHTFELNKRLGDETYYFIYNDKPKIRFKTFDDIIQIQTGSLYNLHQVTQTYKALNNLKIYNSSNIDFEPVENNNDSINLLNCNILLNRAKVNYYNLQLEGTNSSGDLGVLGSFTYRNKNIFKGSEVFNISLRAGIQAQSVLDDEGTSLFNTKEFGIDASIFFPKFLSPVKLINFTKEYQPRTTLTVGYNLQIRPIYTRQITLLTFGYNWMKNKYEQHIFTPLTLNSVKVDPTPSFEAILEQEINQRIKDQYTSHLIFGLDYTYIFNNQNVRFIKDFFYFKANVQSSGNLLSAFNNTSAIKTVDNYHEILGIRYAQYIRFSFDFRYFKYVSGENQIATRFMLGAGIPYGNSNDMPFEKSFYAGGSNGMRGWQFRELGPGTFSNPDNLNIERIGDIQLEFNLEYRFPIHSFIKGAIFTDIGNIWTMRENETFAGGQFKFNTFYKQLAADAGIGLRFDFSFFLFRLDAATPIVNPAYPEGERWRISKLQFRDFILNFGIGYPF